MSAVHPSFAKFVKLLAEESELSYQGSWNDVGYDLDDDVHEFKDFILGCNLSVRETKLLSLPELAASKRGQF